MTRLTTLKEVSAFGIALVFGGLYVVDVFGIYNVTQYIPQQVLDIVPVGGPSLIVGTALLFLALAAALTYSRLSQQMTLPHQAQG